MGGAFPARAKPVRRPRPVGGYLPSPRRGNLPSRARGANPPSPARGQETPVQPAGGSPKGRQNPPPLLGRTLEVFSMDHTNEDTLKLLQDIKEMLLGGILLLTGVLLVIAAFV